MNIVFNLKKAFKQIKKAMAGEWLAYGTQMHWWRIDEINAGDPSWLEWVKGDPEKGIKPNKSLINALADAKNDYNRKQLLFRARYGVSKEEVDTFYRMFIGYNPQKGMYALHIGPYTAMPGAWSSTAEEVKQAGLSMNSVTQQELLNLSESIKLPELPPEIDIEDPKNKFHPLVKEYNTQMAKRRRILEVRADKMNKFGSFLKTYNKIDRKNMNTGVNKYLRKLLESAGTVFTEEDLGIELVSFPPEKVGQLEGKITKKIHTKFPSINPQDPNGAELMGSQTLLGDGSFLILNSKGMRKFMQAAAQNGNWGDLYNSAVEEMAKANDKPVEEMHKLIAEDENFSRLFIEELQKIQEQLKAKGDFRADFLDIALKKRPLPPKTGAQQPQTHRISKTQKSIMLLKMEILKTINEAGTDDPTKVAEILNASRKKLKTKAIASYDASIVQDWVNAIKSEDQQVQKLKKKKQNRSYQEIYESVLKGYNQMQSNEELRDAGQDDLADAYQFASTTHMKSPLEFIDKAYRTKLQFTSSPNLFARGGDPNMPVTAKFMTELRSKARVEKGPEDVVIKALKEEIEKEIGEEKPMDEGMQGEIMVDTAPVTETEADVDPAEVAESASGSSGVEGTKPTDVKQLTPTAPTSPEFNFDVTEVPQEKIPNDQPTPTSPSGAEEVKDEDEEKFDLKSLFGHTLNSLIIMARDLDSQGKENAAEEIHKIIRKYQSRI